MDALRQLTIATGLLDQYFSSGRHLDAEDLRARRQLLEPVARATSGLPSFPDESVLKSGPARGIALALWWRTRPEAADPRTLVEMLRFPEPALRLVALDAIDALLRRDDAGAQPGLRRMLASALEQVRAREDSPLLRDREDELLGRLRRRRAPTTTQPIPRPLTVGAANPFEGVPDSPDASSFVGRRETIEEIEAALLSRRAKTVVVRGARRVGKSSLLRHLQSGRLSAEFDILRIDMQAYADSDLVAFWHAVIGMIDGGDAARSSDATRDEILRARLAQALASRAKPVLLLLDEYEVLDGLLRRHGSHAGREFRRMFDESSSLLAVFAGSKRLERLHDGDGLIEAFESALVLKLGLLDARDTAQLVARIGQGRAAFEPGAVSLVHEQSGGHPYYVKALCAAAFQCARQSADARDATVHVQVRDVHAGIDAFLAEPPPHLLLTWNGLSQPARVVATLLAQWEESTMPPGSAVRRLALAGELAAQCVRDALSELDEAEWVAWSGAEAPSLRPPLVVRWLRRYKVDAVERIDVRPDTSLEPASRRRLVLSATVDIVVFLALLSGTLYLTFGSLGRWPFVATAVAYFMVVPLVLRRTVGHLTAGIGLVTPSGRAVPRARLLAYGFYLALRCYMALALAFFMVHVATSVALGEPGRITGMETLAALAFLAVVGVDGPLLTLGARRQGLWELMAGIVLVEARTVR